MFWNKKEKKTKASEETAKESQGPLVSKGPRIQTAEGWNRMLKEKSESNQK